ncbi:MAG: polyprenyl synthetase family protein [Nannocystaceae bacterium]
MTRIDSALAECLAGLDRDTPPKLASAIQHAVFPGGARIRPRLCLAVANAATNDAPELVVAAACSLELLHCASLVHDDLPCFDDADMRRGRPTVHRAFGQPIAVLAGDTLIIMAFEVLARAGASVPSRLAPLLGILARGAGTPHGLVAGQAWESEPTVPLDRYHRAKTSSLFVASAMAGALAAGRDPEPWRTMGECLGQAYQVADDLLDAHTLAADAGKPTGQDTARARPSAVTELGTDGAIDKLRGLVADAASAIPRCPGAEPLRALVVAMAERLVPAGLRRTAA